MKKLLSILIIFIIALTVQGTSLATGEICGEVLNTDIKAYINGAPIKSYNINNWTGIIAEDLRDYGFDVDWDNETRKLYIDTSLNPTTVKANYQFETNDKPNGSHAADVYKTDIKTYVCGKEVNAYNIGGYTVIYIDELQLFGDVIWDEVKREISYTYVPSWSISLKPETLNATHPGVGPYKDGIKEVNATFVKNRNGQFDVLENNLGHFSWFNVSYDKAYGGLKIGFSMIAHHLLADGEFSQFCYDMCTINYDGTRLKDNADFANKHTQIYINGKPALIKDVKMDRGNNHQDYYFILDLNIDKDKIEDISVSFTI